MHKKKRGQITVFLVVGLVILVILGILIYQSRIIRDITPEIPSELQPIQNFVDSCIETITKDAITTIGQNGGYLIIPDSIRADPSAYLQRNLLGEVENPFWWHDGLDSSPKESDIIYQLNKHLDENMIICLNNFNSFKEEFDIKPLGKLTTNTMLNWEDTTIEVRYPLEISDKQKTFVNKDLKKFNVRVPIRLKTIFNLSRQIMDQENKDGFIERKAIDLIAMQDEEKIPISGIGVDCGTKKWILFNIQRELQKLLRINLPFIKIKGTNYDKDSFISLPDDIENDNTFNTSYYQHHYIWDVGAGEQPDVSVSFLYEDYPLELYARPNEKGLYLTANAEKGQDVLSWFCLNIWHFTYDVQFPVKVRLKDQKTETHDEFTFEFAFESFIDHNKPKREAVNTQIFSPDNRLSSEEFCRTDETDNTVTVITINNATEQPVSDVNLSFSCGFFKCQMDTTKTNPTAGFSALTARFPSCNAGVIRGTKENFEDAQDFIQTDMPDSTYFLFMTPVKKIYNFTVVKHAFNPETRQASTIGLPLKEDEKATIIIKAKTKAFSSYAFYPLEHGKIRGLTTSIKDTPVKLLADDDFSYDVEIYLLKGDGIIGGYAGEWDIDWDDLKDASSIKFHIIENDNFPKTDKGEFQRYLFISGLEPYSETIPKPDIR